MLKFYPALFLAIICFSACDVSKPYSSDYAIRGVSSADTLITQSLFADKAATISEENVQKILDGDYRLPQKLRVAIVKLENAQQRRYWWSDEDYLKTQQAYLDLFSDKLKQSARVTKLAVVPDLLISRSPSFTQIREAAVRMQADVAVIYAINSDIYANYKIFGKTDMKAFATTQLVILDVRTGLIPFSTIATKDVLSQKKKEEMNDWEARNRIQSEAVLLTINEIGNQLTNFLQKN